MIKACDWIIDLGPDGGDGGGEIVATGTPLQIATHKDSATGYYLKRFFSNTKDQSPSATVKKKVPKKKTIPKKKAGKKAAKKTARRKPATKAS